MSFLPGEPSLGWLPGLIDQPVLTELLFFVKDFFFGEAQTVFFGRYVFNDLVRIECFEPPRFYRKLILGRSSYFGEPVIGPVPVSLGGLRCIQLSLGTALTVVADPTFANFLRVL